MRAAFEEKKKLADLYCTGCRYCMPCPNGVDIPECFSLMNTYRVYGLLDHARGEYAGWLTEQKQTGAFCQECGQCEPKCPNSLPIQEQLAQVASALA